jgi:hypothetical protein
LRSIFPLFALQGAASIGAREFFSGQESEFPIKFSGNRKTLGNNFQGISVLKNSFKKG